jgi:tetratricopeptide (TPR) repeat protein
LRAAIAWSYDLLFPDDKRGLWALSCFSDGAPLPAVEYVLEKFGVPAAASLDVIERLADRSLVRLELGIGGTVRYRLLDSVRVFAAEQLGQAGLTDLAGRAHANWFADAANRAATGGRGSGQSEFVTLVKNERANIDAALAWATDNDQTLGLAIVNGFGWVWVVVGDGMTGATRIRAALGAAETVAGPVERATALELTGWLEASAGNVAQAHSETDRAIHIADSTGQSRPRAIARWYHCFVLISSGQPADALALLDGCRADFRDLGDRWHEAGSWLLTGHAFLLLGLLGASREACRVALGLLEPIGDQWGLAHAQALLGTIARSEHRLPEAIEHLSEAAAAAARLGFTAAEAYHLSNLGRVQQLADDPLAAIGTLGDAIDKACAAGDFRAAAVARVRLARVLRVTGDRQAARLMTRAAKEWFDGYGGGEGALLAESTLAALDAEDGAVDAAQRLSLALEHARFARDREAEVLTLDALARCHASAGELDLALELLGRADDIMPAAAHLVFDSDRVDARFARVVIEEAQQAVAPSAPT